MRNPSMSDQLVCLSPSLAHSLCSKGTPAADGLASREESQHRRQERKAENHAAGRIFDDGKDTSQAGECKQEGSDRCMQVSFNDSLVIHIAQRIGQ